MKDKIIEILFFRPIEDRQDAENTADEILTLFEKSSIKVYDIETDSLHDLVSIDAENNKVVMKNKKYGYTGNTLDKVRLIQI